MNTADRQPLIQVKDLHIAFGERRRRFEAVKGVTFDIYKGETFGLVGESGSGKTSIGRAIIRVYSISGGEVIYDGQRISGKIDPQLDRRVTREIQMIF
ncbi:MAG: ATP-binding cassette domain-containing protein, partial [Clostridiales bacterium]|nr:ATP-binding cassette domain-containing protein [Clostridiales bacterium]